MQVRRLGVGIVAGLIGGVVFGAMMHMMGMIGMIAGLVGQDSAAIGWVVHLVNSAVIGAIYGATFGQLPHSWGRGAGLGLGYGVIWWILGALLIMPLWMGMPAFQVGETQVWSLVGHLMYGLVTGLVFTAAIGQTTGQPAPTH